MLMLRLMTRHMPFEITSFGVQPLIADIAVHLVSIVAAGDVLVANLLVHEGFGAAGESAFEGAVFVGARG